MRKFGLIGKKLTHSFSKKHFEGKFECEKIEGCTYSLFELPDIDHFPGLIASEPLLRGLNVTIPYKQEIIPYLDALDQGAARIGAVNVILLEDGKLTGYNSDYFGFKASLASWVNASVNKALVLGTGGASKAVVAALEVLGIEYIYVSRTPLNGGITYAELAERPEIIQSTHLIINTSPVGMFPLDNEAPDLPYAYLTPRHFLYDLVYNPEVTLFMKKGQEQGAKVKNGLEMLQLQAEKAWEIWNKNS